MRDKKYRPILTDDNGELSEGLIRADERKRIKTSLEKIMPFTDRHKFYDSAEITKENWDKFWRDKNG